jgi:hypothetical protein
VHCGLFVLSLCDAFILSNSNAVCVNGDLSVCTESLGIVMSLYCQIQILCVFNAVFHSVFITDL